VADRHGVGSWLQGPGLPGKPGDPAEYPGQRLGLPRQGVGSLARFGPRLLAYLVDSLLSAIIAWGLLGDQRWTVVVFGIEVLVLTALGGASFGQHVVGMRVVRPDGRAPGVARAAIRTALLLLLIPALIWDRDGRGLHDRAAGTMLVRVR
jgi:uncharacterized RDD family membrane protein YckC